MVHRRGLQVRGTNWGIRSLLHPVWLSPAVSTAGGGYRPRFLLPGGGGRPAVSTAGRGDGPRSDRDSPQRKPAFELRLDRELGPHLGLEHQLSFVVATLV